MCEEDSVNYLRDLIREKDILDKEEEHSVLQKMLTQGKKEHIQHVQLNIRFQNFHIIYHNDHILCFNILKRF